MASSEPRWIRGLTEHLPIVLFLGAYYLGSLTFAIQVIVVSTVMALVIAWLVARRLPTLPLVASGLVLVFGGVAWAVGDDTIYKMKPTVMQVLLAVGLLGGLRLGRLFLKELLSDGVDLADAAWRRLTFESVGLLLLLAATNEVVWRTQSETFWVNFKVFGLAGVTIAFLVARTSMLARAATAAPPPP
jgi:intracellular septation protein